MEPKINFTVSISKLKILLASYYDTSIDNIKFILSKSKDDTIDLDNLVFRLNLRGYKNPMYIKLKNNVSITKDNDYSNFIDIPSNTIVYAIDKKCCIFYEIVLD